jgi:hypothetical protein
VVNHVLQKPGRHEGRIQKRVNSDNAVFFLDRPKDKIFFRRQSSASAPSNGVSFEGIIEILGVQLIENRFEIEVLALVKKLELPLKWKPFD